MSSDQSIIRLIRQNEQQGFDLLYERYAPQVYGYLLRQLNQDMEQAGRYLQKVFVEAHSSLRESDPSEIRLSLWLLAIARRQVEDKAKQQQALRFFKQQVDQAGLNAETAAENREICFLLLETMQDKNCSLKMFVDVLGWQEHELGRLLRKALNYLTLEQVR